MGHKLDDVTFLISDNYTDPWKFTSSDGRFEMDFVPIIDRAALLNIIENAIDYTVDFDLLVPPYDAVKVVTVDQLNTKIENSKMQTGKRLGYKFNSDDI